MKPKVIIQTDASLTGWGAVCNGVQTSGQWTEEERSLHINVLELLAIKLALFSFTRGKRVKAIHFQIDNKAAFSYLWKMGGTKNEYMIRLSKEIWHYLLNHNMAITAEYLPSVLKTVADRESRKKTRLFRVGSLSQSFSSGFSTTRFSDKRVFASCLCHQLPQYIAWHPDPYSQGTDAMIQNWNIGLPYAFPPFSMISRVLLKIKQECVPLLILIAPVWSTQPWYPEVLNLCVREPVLLPQRQKNLKSPKNIVHPLMLENSLTLAAWLVSGKPSCVKEFQKTLLTLSQIPDEKAHSLIMSQPEENGLLGVLNEKLILFRHL